jgi:NDP-4-keto-2,6-dideoxyhexose 3-C-methyltransferase
MHEEATTPPWFIFNERVQQSCEQTYEHLLQAQIARKSAALLGASTKGNVFLQEAGLHMGLARLAWERDLSKHGHVTLGTGIPIWSEDGDKGFDQVKLVMPWHFLPEIVGRQLKFLEEGGEIIAALPSFRKINLANWEVEIANFKREVGE